eukprot:tig00001415_g8682.t1
MYEEDFETAVKVIVVGNGGIGKTSMIKRFGKGEWTDGYKKTIGVDFLEKEHYIPALGETVKMMLWDTAGQEEFDAITRTYYRGAGACVIAFSTTDRESFEAVENWKRKVEAECGPIAMALVQNKVDLLDQAVVTKEEAEETARKLNMRFYRMCVKENLNVTEVFEYLATQFITRKNQGAAIEAAAPPKQQPQIGKLPTAAAAAPSLPTANGAAAAAAAAASQAEASAAGAARQAAAAASAQAQGIAPPAPAMLSSAPQSATPTPAQAAALQQVAQLQAQAAQPRAPKPHDPDAPFRLERPSIQRTKGKKKKKLMDCTIL